MDSPGRIFPPGSPPSLRSTGAISIAVSDQERSKEPVSASKTARKILLILTSDSGSSFDGGNELGKNLSRICGVEEAEAVSPGR